MKSFPLLIILGCICTLFSCGSRSALQPQRDGSTTPRDNSNLPPRLDVTAPMRDLLSMDFPTYREMRIGPDYQPDPCVGPAGEPLDTYIGNYPGTWSGQLDCQFYGLSFSDTETSLLIQLDPTFAPGTLRAHGTLSLDNIMLKGTIEGTMQCFELVANITIGINTPIMNDKLTGTMWGTLQPTWGIPPHFGEGTWQVDNPATGCKGYGTWRGVW